MSGTESDSIDKKGSLVVEEDAPLTRLTLEREGS
jgi:hypothetical protein